MSASVETSAIYLTDSNETITFKIMKHAFSGGKDTKEEHQREGGNPDIDVSYQYLCFFEDSDEKLQEYYDNYKSGKMLSSEMKKALIEVLIERVGRHKRARALVTEDIVDSFMAVRKMNVLGEKK